MSHQNVQKHKGTEQNSDEVKRYLMEHYKKSGAQKIEIAPYHGYRKLHASRHSKIKASFK